MIALSECLTVCISLMVFRSIAMEGLPAGMEPCGFSRKCHKSCVTGGSLQHTQFQVFGN